MQTEMSIELTALDDYEVKVLLGALAACGLNKRCPAPQGDAFMIEPFVQRMTQLLMHDHENADSYPALVLDLADFDDVLLPERARVWLVLAERLHEAASSISEYVDYQLHTYNKGRHHITDEKLPD